MPSLIRHRFPFLLLHRVPAQSVPARSVPARSVPAHRVPAHRVPARSVPAHRVPARSVPAHRVPAQSVPAQSVPAQSTSAQSASAQSASAQSASAHRVLTVAMIMLCLWALMGRDVAAQALPASAGEWTRRDTATLSAAKGLALLGGRVDDLRGFAVTRVYSAVYQRGGEQVRTLVVQAASNDDAFGILAVQAGEDFISGVPGDARCERRGSVLFVYGSFYCELVRAGTRGGALPDAQLADALRRWMYTQDDCHPTPIPLPVDERVFGRERFIAGRSLWRGERRRLSDAVASVLDSERAWVGVYRKRVLPIERVLYMVSTPDTASARALYSALSVAMEEGMRPVDSPCGTRATATAGAMFLLFRNNRDVLIVRTDRSDDGACWWIHDLYTAAR